MWRIGGSHPIRMKVDQIVDNRMAKAWKSIIPYLNYRDKYNLFNTCKFFRYTPDLSTVSTKPSTVVRVTVKIDLYILNNLFSMG